MHRRLIILLLIASSLFAEAQERDAGLWLSGELQARINPKWELQGAGELRFRENFSQLGSAFSDLGLQYRLGENWRLAFHYRLIARRREDGSFGNRQRFYTDVIYRTSLRPLDLSFRLRLQHQQADAFSLIRAFSPQNTVRSRVSLKWDSPWLAKPHASFELFHPFIMDEVQDLRQVRAIVGFDLDFNKWHGITIFYLFQSELNVAPPGQDFVIGIEYRFAPRSLPPWFRS